MSHRGYKYTMYKTDILRDTNKSQFDNLETRKITKGDLREEDGSLGVRGRG